MAATQARGVKGGFCVPLSRPLTPSQTKRVREHLRRLLSWQERLSRWPAVPRLPDATPFVTLYAGGVLRGCFGSHEGPPGERLTRAFLRALEDSRYGSVRPGERVSLTAMASYVRTIRPIEVERVPEELVAGVEGLAAMREGSAPVMLLPNVARDQRAGPGELLQLLARKAGFADWRGVRLFAFETEDVVIRPAQAARTGAVEPRRAAASWLARLVGSDGAVAFAIDARRRTRVATGVMHHGRAACVVRALRHARVEMRAAGAATRWLERDVKAALRGAAVEGWPRELPMAAGTIALASMAGLDLEPQLVEFARSDGLAASPWHAAQVVAALGPKAPDALWRACKEHLAVQPWAPWTLLAARARRDAQCIGATAPALCASIRDAAPHRGGCNVVAVPETALTALVVEALDGLPDAQARAAVARARSFLRARQLLDGSMPAPLDPDLARGGFAASPVVVDMLRCDVAAHAFVAIW
jgi:AMMECR1 domain-containing protein